MLEARGLNSVDGLRIRRTYTFDYWTSMSMQRIAEKKENWKRRIKADYASRIQRQLASDHFASGSYSSEV